MTHIKSESAGMIFVLGLTIGSVLTALLSPKNGNEVRRSLKSKMESAKSKAKNTADEMGNVAENKMDEAIEAVQRGRRKLNNDDQPDNPII